MNYLIYGSSFNLIDEEVKKILEGRHADSYSLDEVSLKEILDDLGYNSMFDNEKVLILKNFESLANSKKDNNEILSSLEEYLKNPIDSTIIIFISNEKISNRGSLKNIINKLKVIETPIITKPYELAKILGELFKREGYGITSASLNVFAEKCATNYDIALKEFEKLKIIKGDNKLISEMDIEEYISNYNMTDMFGFKDAVVNRNIKKALTMLDDLESSKMEVVPLVIMLTKEYQIVYNIKLMGNKKYTNDQISKELGNMHPYRVKLLREAGNKYTEVELEKLILTLCNLNLSLVSEDNLGYDEIRKFLLLL